MSNWFEDENPDAPGNEKRIRDKPVRDDVGIHDPNPPSDSIHPGLKDRVDQGRDDYRNWLDNEKRLNDQHSGLDRLHDGDVPPQDEPRDEDPATPEG